jgi:hypothetical protein
MSLKDVITAAKNGIKDLTELEVQTYTGQIEVAIDTIGTTNFTAILDTAKATGNIKLSQVTKISIDGDAINLVPDTAPPEHAAEAHKSALEAGQNVRSSILELFKDLIEKY